MSYQIQTPDFLVRLDVAQIFSFYTPVSRRAVLWDWVWRAGVHTGFHTITLVLYIGSLPELVTWYPCRWGRTLFILGLLGQRSRSLLLYIEFLTTGSFPHDNFRSVYWIFTKLDHMIALWNGKNPIYFGVIRSKVKVTVTINIIFYRLIIYIDRRILWSTHFLFVLWCFSFAFILCLMSNVICDSGLSILDYRCWFQCKLRSLRPSFLPFGFL